MIYDEKKALEIIEKYNLAPSVGKIWKHRGKIPDRYFKGEYHKPQPIKEDNINLKMVLSFLEREDVVIRKFLVLADILPQKYHDTQRGRYKWDKREIMDLKKVIISFFNDVKKLTDSSLGEKQLRSFLKKKMIYVNKIFADKYFFSKLERNQINYWLGERQGSMCDDLRTKMIKRIYEFETEANKFY